MFVVILIGCKLRHEHQCGSMYASAHERFFGIGLNRDMARLSAIFNVAGDTFTFWNGSVWV